MNSLEIHTRTTSNGAKTATTGNYDSYIEVLLKLVPVEVVGAYLTIQGIVGSKPVTGIEPEPGNASGMVLFISAGLLFVATPFVMMKLRGITDKWHILFGTIGFPVWLFATGTALFSYLPDAWWMSPERERIASVALVLFAFVVPFFYKPDRLSPGTD